SINEGDLSIYSEQIIGIQTLPFEKLVALRQSGVQAEIIEEMADIEDLTQGEGLIQFNLLLRRLSINSKVKLLEDSMTAIINGQSTPLAQAVVNRFQVNIYTTTEPWR